MKKLSLKIFILILISSIVFLLSNQKARSCGPEFIPDEYYTMIDKTLFSIPELSPFFLSENLFADNTDGQEESHWDNLKEWVTSIKRNASIDHVETVIYKTNMENLLNLRNCLLTKDMALLPSLLKDNSFVNYLRQLNSTEIIDYLLFAKKCEPEVTNGVYWNEKVQDTVLMKNLIEEGIKNRLTSQKKFIKDRYSYQVIRLAHYLKQYNMCVSLYNRFFTEQKKMTLIQYWSFAHKAGALRNLGNIAEANLIFARIFDKCSSRRKQSILSIKLDSDSILNKTLQLCKTKSDSVLVYTISAYKNQEKSIDHMYSISRLKSKSKYLELLLSREMTRLERDVLPRKESWGDHRSYFRENMYSIDPDDRLFKVVSEIARNGNSSKPYLWNFAAGYIATLLNKQEEAGLFYLKAKKGSPKNDMAIVRRIQIAEIVSKINGLDTIDRKIEDIIIPDINWLYELAGSGKYNSKDALIYVMSILAKKYFKQGNRLKANLCLGTNIVYTDNYSYYDKLNPFGYNLKPYYHLEPIDEIRTVLISASKSFLPYSDYTKKYSDFERFLIQKYTYTAPELSYILTKSYISKGLFEKAIELLADVNSASYSNDYTEILPADPFSIRIKDCLSCDLKANNQIKYTVLEFCRKMIELKKLAEEDTANSSQYYYLIANGLYNKSYYGSSYDASVFYRDPQECCYDEGLNKDFYDCSEAREYYLKAMNRSKDREFAAKCLFMASKCELNLFYNSPEYKSQSTPLEYRTHFKELKAEYNDTYYYKEILKECKYFRNFTEL